MREARDGLRRLRLFWGWLRRSIIWGFLARQRRWVIAMLVLAVVNFALTLGIVGAIRGAFDEAIIDQTEPLRPFVVRIAFLGVLAGLAGFAQRQVTSRIGYHLEFDLRTWLYSKLQSVDPRGLNDLASGQLMTRAMTDLLLLERLILVIPILGMGITLLVALGVIVFFIDPFLALLALSAIPVNLYLVMRIRKRLWALSWVALQRRGEVTTAIDEAVRGIRVVKAFGREEQERERVKDAARGAFAVSMTRVRLVARYDLILNAMPIVLSAGLIALGAQRAVGGALTIGELLIFLLFAGTFIGFARNFDEIMSGWQFAKTGAGRIFQMVTGTPQPVETQGRPLPEATTGLHMEDVAFRSGGRDVLSEFGLAVRPGELVVLRGPAGSGKTTVAALASGMMRATAGSVRLDGVDLSELDPSEVRRAVRVVDEEPFLFGRTVRENLEMGAGPAGASEDALWAALRAAGAEDFVEQLPDQLDSILGDRGMTLSGGQRQRLALARALVVPPRVLVLDDGLSAVNPSLELEILKRVKEHAPRSAILCITRREGPTGLADGVVELSAPNGADAPAGPVGRHRRDDPYHPELVSIIAGLPADRDEPEVGEEEATESDRIPTVPSVLRPFAKRVLQVTLILLAFTAVSLVPEGLTMFAIDGIDEGRVGPAYRVALAIGVVSAVVAVCAYFFRIFAKRVDEGILYLLRRRIFQRLSRLGIDYYDRDLPGHVAARVVHDLDRISSFVDTGIYAMAVSLALLIGSFTVITVWSPPVALAVVLYLPVLVIVTALQVPVAARAYQWARREMGKVAARLQEDFAGRFVLDSFGARTQATRDFGNAAWELRRARRWSTSVTNLYVEIVQSVVWLATATLIWRAGGLAIAGALTVGSVVALQLYLRNALAPVGVMSGVLQLYLAARASFRTLQEPYRTPIQPVERPEARACPPLEGRISFEAVSFAYPGTVREVLHDVSLQVPPGKTVAVVGPTGAGKTSLAKLLARIYDPDRGAVCVDGMDLRDIDLSSYRARIGMVPQDGFCFRGTVASNIAYGRPGASREEIERAAMEIGAYDAICALPGGFDALVEEEGRNLSAAHRQYIALARVWVADADLLILDEATSSLGMDAEEAVLRALRRLRRTSMLVTHRLNIAQQADLVIVVDRGRVVELGSHEDLMATGGRYADLWSHGSEVDERAGVEAPPGPASPLA